MNKTITTILILTVVLLSGCDKLKELYGLDQETKYIPMEEVILEEEVTNNEGCIIETYGYGIELRIKSEEKQSFELYIDDKFIGIFDTVYDDFFGWHKHFCGNGGSGCLEGNYIGKLKYKSKIKITYYDNKQIIEQEFGCYEYLNIPLHTCYDTKYTIYNGEINNTCYFYGCKDKCEKKEINECFKIYGELDQSCINYYLDCVEDCIKEINYDNIEEYFAHEFGCLINETIEIIPETRCY